LSKRRVGPLGHISGVKGLNIQRQAVMRCRMRMRMGKRRRRMKVRKMLMRIVVRQMGRAKSANRHENENPNVNAKENVSLSFFSLRTLRISARQAGNMGFRPRRLLRGLFGSWRMISRTIRGMYVFFCSIRRLVVRQFIHLFSSLSFVVCMWIWRISQKSWTPSLMFLDVTCSRGTFARWLISWS